MSDKFEGWAIVELMGHRKLAGQVSEVLLAGAPMLRITVPGRREGEPDSVHYHAPGALYGLHPVPEDQARAAARHYRPEIVPSYLLAAPRDDVEEAEVESDPAPRHDRCEVCGLRDCSCGDDDGPDLETCEACNRGVEECICEMSCRVCGCTENDCSGCVERTGSPCEWVEHPDGDGVDDLCSACVERLVIAEHDKAPQPVVLCGRHSDEAAARTWRLTFVVPPDVGPCLACSEGVEVAADRLSLIYASLR